MRWNQVSYRWYAEWDVSAGTVDLIAPVNSYGLTATDGMFVDLDGSTGDAGVMTTKDTFSFLAGTSYVLTFDLSGNQRGYLDPGAASDTVDVLIGLAGISFTTTMAPTDPWTSYSITFTFGTNVGGPLSFANRGGDNVGALLDNVVLSGPNAVPETGATLALLGLAMSGLGLVRRRVA